MQLATSAKNKIQAILYMSPPAANALMLNCRDKEKWIATITRLARLCGFDAF
jgi:hypothetical protein